MARLWISAEPNGKIQVLLGAAATRKRRRLGLQIDRVIRKALSGTLKDSDRGQVEVMAALADRLARGKAG